MEGSNTNREGCLENFGILFCLVAYTVFTTSFSLLGIFMYKYLVNAVVPEALSMLMLLSVLYILSMIFVGVFIDLFGGERLIMLSFSLVTSATLAVVVFVFPRGLLSYITTGLIACATAWFPVALGSYMNSNVDIRCRGTIYGLGTGTGTLIAFVLYGLLSPRIVLAVVSIIIAIAGLMVLVAVRNGLSLERRVFKPTQIFYRRIFQLSLSIFIFYTMAGFVLVKFYSLLVASSLSAAIYITMVPYLIFVITAGFLIDFIGRKIIGITGFMLLSVGNMVLALLEEYSSVLLSIIIPLTIIRAAYGFIDVYAIVTLIDLAGRRSRGLSIAVGLIAMSLGIFSGSVISGLIEISRLSVVMATLILIATIYVVLKIPETLPKKPISKDDILKYIDRARKIAGKER